MEGNAVSDVSSRRSSERHELCDALPNVSHSKLICSVTARSKSFPRTELPVWLGDLLTVDDCTAEVCVGCIGSGSVLVQVFVLGCAVEFGHANHLLIDSDKSEWRVAGTGTISGSDCAATSGTSDELSVGGIICDCTEPAREPSSWRRYRTSSDGGGILGICNYSNHNIMFLSKICFVCW